MTNEEMQEKAKKQLHNLSAFVEALQKALKPVEILHNHAIKRALHKRAIITTKTLKGLNELIDELQDGQALCLEILGARKIPIDNQDKPKLKLVVDNERRKS